MSLERCSTSFRPGHCVWGPSVECVTAWFGPASRWKEVVASLSKKQLFTNPSEAMF